jgi:hypothetical protein
MTIRKRVTDPFEVEKPHPLVAEPAGNAAMGPPLTVRLGGLWTDLMRGPEERTDAPGAPRSPSAVPLLDDMKGILQWD